MAEIVFRDVFKSFQQPVVEGGVEIVALIPRDLTYRCEGADAELRMSLIAATLLDLARGAADIVADGAVVVGVIIKINCFLVHGPRVEPDSGGEVGLCYDRAPVAIRIGGGVVEFFADGQEDGADHPVDLVHGGGGNLLIRIAKYLHGVDDLHAFEPGEEGGIICRRDRGQAVRIGFEDGQGPFCVCRVFCRRPHEGVEISGAEVGLEGGFCVCVGAVAGDDGKGALHLILGAGQRMIAEQFVGAIFGHRPVLRDGIDMGQGSGGMQDTGVDEGRLLGAERVRGCQQEEQDDREESMDPEKWGVPVV